VFKRGDYMKLGSLFHQRERKILSVAIVLIITICFLSPMFSLKDYNSLLNADTLKIYSNDKLITTVDNPAYMMDTFGDNIVGIYLTDTSKLGINRRSMSELYRLEFLKDGKVISSIKILTPKNQKDIDNINESFGTEWREFDDHFAIMSENFQYFLFGESFFENLSEALKK